MTQRRVAPRSWHALRRRRARRGRTGAPERHDRDHMAAAAAHAAALPALLTCVPCPTGRAEASGGTTGLSTTSKGNANTNSIINGNSNGTAGAEAAGPCGLRAGADGAAPAASARRARRRAQPAAGAVRCRPCPRMSHAARGRARVRRVCAGRVSLRAGQAHCRNGGGGGSGGGGEGEAAGATVEWAHNNDLRRPSYNDHDSGTVDGIDVLHSTGVGDDADAGAKQTPCPCQDNTAPATGMPAVPALPARVLNWPAGRYWARHSAAWLSALPCRHNPVHYRSRCAAAVQRPLQRRICSRRWLPCVPAGKYSESYNLYVLRVHARCD